MPAEPLRSRKARAAAERALVRVVHHYGEIPAFVLLGGLVPELLCRNVGLAHAGTTDIDVQVDLDVAAGSVNARRLEGALANAEFVPDSERVWRWRADGDEAGAQVKFELLADRDDTPAGATVIFAECESLGAANLRGTGWATRDYAPAVLTARIGGTSYSVFVNVAGLAGFLVAKLFAAKGRGLPKDWYDIAFVVLHNDEGGPEVAGQRVRALLGDAPSLAVRSALAELEANFATSGSQGPTAYGTQMELNHPELSGAMLRADAVLAVDSFLEAVRDQGGGATR